MAGIFVRDYFCRRAQPASFAHPSLRTRSIFGSPEEEDWCSLSVGLWNLSVCQSNASTPTWSTRRNSHKTTFLLIEPDIHRAVIVRWPTHGVVLGRDVLDLLCDDPGQYRGTAFGMRESTFLSRRNFPDFVFGQVLPVTTSPKFSGIPSGPENTFVWKEYL